MFSGKSESLLAWIRAAEQHGIPVRAVLPGVAARFQGAFVTSHDGDSAAAVVVETPLELERLTGAAALAIDEVQFFDRSVAGAIERLARDGTRIAVAGLDRDFRSRPFPSTLAVETLADSVHRLTARCAVCGAPAALTQRLVEGAPAPPDEQVIRPGDEHLYEPRCSSCFVRLAGY